MHILNNATWKFNPVFIGSWATSGYEEVLSLTEVLQIAVVIHRVLSFVVLALYGYGFKLIFCLSAGKGTEKTTADDDQGNWIPEETRGEYSSTPVTQTRITQTPCQLISLGFDPTF